jgi:hypothetical protein
MHTAVQGWSSRPPGCALADRPDSSFPDGPRTLCRKESLARTLVRLAVKRFGNDARRVGSSYEVGRRRRAGHSASETPRPRGPSRRGVSAIFSAVSVVRLLIVVAEASCALDPRLFWTPGGAGAGASTPDRWRRPHGFDLVTGEAEEWSRNHQKRGSGDQLPGDVGTVPASLSMSQTGRSVTSSPARTSSPRFDRVPAAATGGVPPRPAARPVGHRLRTVVAQRSCRRAYPDRARRDSR